MLAATEQREMRACAGNPAPPGRQIARQVFRAAYRELCARIWLELELLAQAVRQFAGFQPQDLLMSAAILRLELVVLVDSCRSPHWRCMLSAQQCDSLCSMLTDVLAGLHVDPEHLHTGIAEAQDRVLDELVAECEIGTPLTAPASACEVGEPANPAVEELVGLIEAKAAARSVQSSRWK